MFRAKGVAWKDAQSLASDKHAQFEISDPWESEIEAWLKAPNRYNQNNIAPADSDGISTADILLQCLGMYTRFWNKVQEKRVWTVMKKLGYELKQRRRNGAKPYLWCKKKS